MKTTPTRTIMRRATAQRHVGRSRTEAAAELVRMEYERERLRRALDALNERSRVTRDDLADIDQRIGFLHEILGFAQPDDAPPIQAVAPSARNGGPTAGPALKSLIAGTKK